MVELDRIDPAHSLYWLVLMLKNIKKAVVSLHHNDIPHLKETVTLLRVACTLWNSSATKTDFQPVTKILFCFTLYVDVKKTYLTSHPSDQLTWTSVKTNSWITFDYKMYIWEVDMVLIVGEREAEWGFPQNRGISEMRDILLYFFCCYRNSHCLWFGDTLSKSWFKIVFSLHKHSHTVSLVQNVWADSVKCEICPSSHLKIWRKPIGS